EVFIVSVRRFGASHRGFLAAVYPAPAAQIFFPFSRDFREYVDSNPRVFTAFGVVGCAGVHRMRPVRGSALIEAMEFLGGQAKPIGLTTDFVQREQPAINIKR